MEISKVKGNFDQILVKAVILLMCFYHFYIAIIGAPNPLVVRPIHVAFVIFLGFMKFPSKKGEAGKVCWYDWSFALLGVASAVYVQMNYERIVWRMPFIDHVTIGDWFFGIVTIALILELCRRSVGKPLMIIAILFISYTLFGMIFPMPFYHPGIPAKNLLEHLFLSSNGLYGSLTSLSLAEIFMFIFFGALLQGAGASEFFKDITAILTRKTIGGPAKAAVISSALFGSVCGSGVANVFATGVVTIPLMKKYGFKAEFAAGVESVSSTLGQLIPPVMGASAFLIAEFSERSYFEVAKAAIVPSILYVLAIYLSVHFEAVKIGMKIPKYKEKAHSLMETFKKYGNLIIPVIILVTLLAERRSAYNSVTIATLSVIVISWLSPATRMGGKQIMASIETGIWRVVNIAIILITAGVAVSALQTTGTVFRMTSIILELSQGNLLFLLFLVALMVIILGMGLPPVGAFLVASLFAAPAMMKFGVDPFVAYMFIFMYCIVANVTPPVCTTTYAAATIANCNFMRAGLKGFIIAIPAYIIPFFVIFNPRLLFLFSGGFLVGVYSLLTAIIGVVSIVISISGFLLIKMNILQQVVAFLMGCGLMWTGIMSDLFGISGMLIIFFWQYRLRLISNNKKD